MGGSFEDAPEAAYRIGYLMIALEKDPRQPLRSVTFVVTIGLVLSLTRRGLATKLALAANFSRFSRSDPMLRV